MKRISQHFPKMKAAINNVDIKDNATLLVNKVGKALSHPATRSLLLTSLVICLCVTTSYAEGNIEQTSNTIEATIKNLFTQIYDNFRIPISAVALTIAAAKFASSDNNGRKQAYLIGGGILLFWIIPGVITFFGDVAKN